MNQNNKWKKVTIAGITAVAVTVGALCSSADQKSVLAATPDKPETLFKEETVYVTAKADGTPVKTVVSDWMKNAGTVADLSDQTILTDIENVKGNETYTKGANHQITWKTKGTDIYYQGKSEKNPAVGVNITYKLNGKDVTAKQIKGKTGKMEMHIAYTNQQKQEDMYVPFTMITGVMLPTDQFQNVSVDHGKIVSDADKVMVVGIGFPGLKENLDLKEAPVTIPISDCVTITADVTDFSMGATFTAASSDGMDQAGFTEVQNYEQLETSLNKLTDASDSLVSGTKELAEGTHLLDGKSVELKAGIQKLAEGVEAYTDGEEALSSGTKQLLGGTQNIQAGTNRLQSGASELQSGIEAAKAGADQLVAGYENGVTEGAQQLEDGTAQLYGTVEQMSGGLQNVPLPTQEQIDELAQMGDVAGAQAVAATVGAMQQVLNQAGALEGATKQLSVGAADLNGGIVQLADGTSDLQSGLSKLQQGGEQLNVGLGTLGEGVGQLQDGAQTLNDGATKLQQSNGQLLSGTSALVAGGEQLTTGTSTLAAGAGTLQNGMQKFQQVKTRMDKMMELGKNYKSFAGIDSKMDGSVKFVIETKEIK